MKRPSFVYFARPSIFKITFMKNILFTLVFFVFAIAFAAAQDLSYGFRAGLSFANLDGPKETDETFDLNTGFHIGFGFGVSFTDIWGARAELVYSQKGAKYEYDGASYLMLVSKTNRELTYTGNRKTSLTINNSYIDIPVTVFARPVEWLEISAGAYAGFLAASGATGDLKFDSPNLDPIALELDYNYYADEAREGDTESPIAINAKNSSEEFLLANPAGAYYFLSEKKANLFKTIDFGLLGGLNFYLNRGLYLGGRVQYGLADVTNTDADFSAAQLDNGKLVAREDKDSYLIYQASIGFNF
jgi:opacity protein-like surface antigen